MYVYGEKLVRPDTGFGDVEWYGPWEKAIYLMMFMQWWYGMDEEEVEYLWNETIAQRLRKMSTTPRAQKERDSYKSPRYHDLVR